MGASKRKSKRRSTSVNSLNSENSTISKEITNSIQNTIKDISKEQSEGKIITMINELQNFVQEQFKIINEKIDKIMNEPIKDRNPLNNSIINAQTRRQDHVNKGRRIEINSFINDRKFAYFNCEKNKFQAQIYQENIETEKVKVPRKFMPTYSRHENESMLSMKRKLAVEKTRLEIERLLKDSEANKELKMNIDKEFEKQLKGINDDEARRYYQDQWNKRILLEENKSMDIIKFKMNFFRSSKHLYELFAPAITNSYRNDNRSQMSTQHRSHNNGQHNRYINRNSYSYPPRYNGEYSTSYSEMVRGRTPQNNNPYPSRNQDFDDSDFLYQRHQMKRSHQRPTIPPVRNF